MDESKIIFKSIDEYIGQFPFNKPIPYELINKIVKCRVEENKKEAEKKSKKK